MYITPSFADIQNLSFFWISSRNSSYPAFFSKCLYNPQNTLIDLLSPFSIFLATPNIPLLNFGIFFLVSLWIKSAIGPQDSPPPLAFFPLISDLTTSPGELSFKVISPPSYLIVPFLDDQNVPPLEERNVPIYL